MNTASFSSFNGGAGGNAFGVSNIFVNTRSGNYAEENCFDFYVATINNIEGTTPVYQNYFAFNSYSVSDSYIGRGDNSGFSYDNIIYYNLKY